MAESQLRVYSITDGIASECKKSSYQREKEIQKVIENNMEVFFGVRLLKSEFVITEGRMDSIGIDENNSPVIFEYKLNENQNVINQGLFYLDWLMDHKGDFRFLVQEKFGTSSAEQVDWDQPTLICVAREFTRYDLYAIKQIDRNIRLVRYSKYDNDLLSLEYLNFSKAASDSKIDNSVDRREVKQEVGSVHLKNLASADQNIKDLYHSLCEYIDNLGDDINASQQKLYLAYKKIHNFACILIQKKRLVVNLQLDVNEFEEEKNFSRDVSDVGHHGTGDYQIFINNEETFNKALPLIKKAYDLST